MTARRMPRCLRVHTGAEDERGTFQSSLSRKARRPAAHNPDPSRTHCTPVTTPYTYRYNPIHIPRQRRTKLRAAMANQPFTLLSDAEFRKLSPAEKDAYVRQLREYVNRTDSDAARTYAKPGRPK